MQEQRSGDTFVFDTKYLKDDLKGHSVRGGAVTIVSQALKFLIRLGSTVILARLLSPKDYGLLAMVMVVVNFAQMFKDLGLSMATVQRASITHEQVNILFWVNVALGLCIAVILSAVAPAVAWFYDEPKLTLIVIVLAITFLISGFGIQHQALLRRHMKFLTLSIILVCADLIAVVTAVTAAFLGAGYWSLVIMQIANAFTITVLAWIVCGWRPGKIRRNVGARSLLAYGGNLTGFNVINFFSRNADNILIGKVWGASTLGLYNKGYTLVMQPLNQLRTPLSSVAIPLLSILQQEPQRYRRAFLLILRLQLLILPFFSIFIICPDWVVYIILGERWMDAAPIFGWLSIACAAQVMVMSNGLLFIPQDRTKELLKWGIVGSSISVASFIAGIGYGAVGVAAAYSLAQLIIVTPALIFYAGRRGAVTGKDFLFGILPFFLILLANTAVLYVLRILLDLKDPFMGILTLSGFSLLLTTLLYFLIPMIRNTLKEAIRLVSHFKKRKET